MPSTRRPRHAAANESAYRGTRFDLSGRVALVTGASRGLGAAIAHALGEAGADLILWARQRARLTRQAERMELLGRRVLAQRVDVTDTAAVRRALTEAQRRIGPVDILVNNAGIWGGDDAMRVPRRVWDAVIESNLTAVMMVSQAVVPSMIKRGYGKIINVSSTSGVRAHEQGAAYGASKAAVIHLTKILAVEWGRYGVRVSSIAPGLFRTDMTRDEFRDRDWMSRRRREIPLRKFGEPDELGGVAVFLASGASDHLTGQTVIVDGGASLTT